MFVSAHWHRIAVGLAPIVTGALVVLIQGTATHVIDPWVIGNALAAGTLTAYLNYLRAGSDVPEMPPKGIER